MLIYFMQHGACLPRQINPEQPLSPVGRGQVEKSARAMRLLGLRPEAMAASNKLRAIQTAEVVAKATGFDPRRIVRSEALKPSAGAEAGLEFLHQFDKLGALFVAGHLPNLALMASQLLSPYPEPIALGLENGGLLCIDVPHLAARNGNLLWLLKPQHLQLLAGTAV